MIESHHARVFEKAFKFVFAKVGYSNCFRFTLLVASFHCFVRIDIVSISRSGVAVRIFRKEFFTPCKGRRPMLFIIRIEIVDKRALKSTNHQIQVDIVGIEILERRIKCLFDIFRMM
jgi:hypothetical protein